MDGRCETCRFWEDDHPWVKGKPGIGVCALTSSRDGKQVWPQTQAVAQDAESYQALLLTHDDFGCVQWEAKGKS